MSTSTPSSSADTRIHGVCITGLERSYPEFSHNVHYSLSNLYAGWRGVDGDGDAAAAPLPLNRAVAFFGIRPANDSWSTVRTDLPPLAGEAIQTPCGLGRAPWFTAWAKTGTQKVTYGFSFIQMMCDLRACHQLVLEHERRVGRSLVTLARLRLDLAWETPLVMPPRLEPNTVYSSRMNTKTGMNDKWALGRRDAMSTYFERVRLIPLANAMWNRTAPLTSLKATGSKEGLMRYDCGGAKINVPFRCGPTRGQSTVWQRADAVGLSYRGDTPVEVPPRAVLPQRRFSMSSEGFLMWALWRGNVSVAFETSWMFCKFGNAVNFTARICVPRMRKRGACETLVCPGGLTDCFCKNSTCADKKGQAVWYCERSRGRQLALDPYQEGEPGVY